MADVEIQSLASGSERSKELDMAALAAGDDTAVAFQSGVPECPPA